MYLTYLCIGIQTIAVLRTTEDYETISEGFSDCFKSINDFVNNPLINVDGIEYQLKLFLSCDYKVSACFHNLITSASLLIIASYLSVYMAVGHASHIDYTFRVSASGCHQSYSF